MSELEAALRGWSPEPLVESDDLPPRPARALAAVLETPDELIPSTTLPPFWHWVHFGHWPRHSELGHDGHPEQGHFLPPIPDRRRMFAGGRLTVTEPLRPGRATERTSSVSDVSVKDGRSGELAFVTVRSEYRQNGRQCLVEEQDHVYRSGESTAKSSAPERPERPPRSDAPWQRLFRGEPTLLFRFSALTANTHRIHYDTPYVQRVESYPDLVVHGPLLVLLMTELARDHRTRSNPSSSQVSTVDYRLHRPVFSGDPVLVTGHPENDSARMRVRNGLDAVMAHADLDFGPPKT